MQNIDLIAYNLGYLPGGDKEITTKAESTIKSCENALRTLSPSGLLSITVYPAHPQGAVESKKLFEWLESLPPEKYHIFQNKNLHKAAAPYLIYLNHK